MIKYLLISVVFVMSVQAQSLVPFYNDASYSRLEQTNPCWWVKNTLAESKLYRNGVYQSSEFGTNDMNIPLDKQGVKVGVIDDGLGHGARVVDCVKQIHTNVIYYPLAGHIFYDYLVASAVTNAVNDGCKVINFSNGYNVHYPSFSNALVYCKDSNVLFVYSVPNIEWNLDAGNIDYPYEYHMLHVLAIGSTDRNGNHFNPSAYGTNCLYASGRNIVAAGTYGSGTSYASPIAAGIASLVWKVKPELTPSELISLLRTASSNGRLNATDSIKFAEQTIILPMNGAYSSSTNLVDWQYAGVAVNHIVIMQPKQTEYFKQL